MADRKALEALFEKHGFSEWQWFDPREAVIAQWVRMKCKHGCDGWGDHPMCPPNAPSVAECAQFFSEYATGVVFHESRSVAEREQRHDWMDEVNARLLALERAVFLAGHFKAFALFPGGCRICANCPTTREECHQPENARPTPEALGMDVFSTVRALGLPIDVLTDYDEPMNRYAFLLVE